MANPTAGHPSLLRLSDADYEVAPGEPDVRGWDVCLADDQKIGDVDDLIIDPTSGKVRYLDVDLDSSALQLERNRHVLVPIADAQLDTEEEEVLLVGMSREALLRLPEYDGKAVERTVEADVRREEVEVTPSPGNILFKDDTNERGS